MKSQNESKADSIKNSAKRPFGANFGIKKSLITTLIVSIVLVIISVGLLYTAQVFTLTPAHIRSPQVDHYHMRMQLFVDGEYIDFGQDKFQETYTPGQCTDGLTDTPIHFHDNKDQYVHIHWDGITGGEVLKYYGINRINGLNNGLGYRTDLGIVPKKVGVHTYLIPDNNKTIHMYQVAENGTITKRDTNDFLEQDLETFFGVKSSITLQREDAERFAFLPRVTPNVYAHEEKTQPSTKSDSELRKLNDLLGDVIIFLQDEEPPLDVVAQYGNNFIELDESTCGG